MTSNFHFTLGPVQGFVSQARRTRDFWAGSFILSWLSAVAMRAVQAQGSAIVFPRPDREFMEALERGGDGPKQGNVPNRFKAAVEEGFDPRRVEETVRGAWESLAEAVWEADLAGYANPATRAIWNRQIGAFWDIQWVLEDGNDASAIDRLKNWRTYLPPPEPGVKCMMMDGWQELSAAVRPGRGADDFWMGLRASGKRDIAADLRPGEMLCAIAYVKRRFARHFKDFKADLPNGVKLRGWKLPTGVPSVHYLAAAPWLAQLLRKARNDEALTGQMWAFHDAAHSLTGDYGEWDSNIRCVKEVHAPRKWTALDGTVFFDAMLENAKLWGERANEANRLLGSLKDLREAAKLGPVSPFYAVLLMDGDQLGAQMGEADKQQAITQGLASFTRGVPGIVDEHNGFLVYAGGDDVLAFLPLEDALACAAHLRRHYYGCFDDAQPKVETSLSGAIEYAHIKMPLGKVLADAHHLLDEVAKDGRGRDALACRVWKPGGLTLEWAMPWECALGADGQVVLDRLVDAFRAQGSEEDEKESFASKFFYRIRERFDLLNPIEGGERIFDEEQALALLATEYLNSGLVRERDLDIAQAKARIQPLLDQCRPVIRDKTKPKEQWWRSPHLHADGALLVRFLAQKGVER
jgi:CRISPR-associated protein Cmr2